MREDVRAVLNLPAGMAASMLANSTELVERLPGMLSVLERGRCSDRHARLLAEATMRLSDEQARQVQDPVLPRAVGSTVAAFGRSVARAVLAVDPADAEDRHREAAAERKVRLCPQRHGRTGLWALLPAAGAAAVMAALDAIAGRPTEPGDERTADQRRADALVQLGIDSLNGPSFNCPKCTGAAGVNPSAPTAAGSTGSADRAGSTGSAPRPAGSPMSPEGWSRPPAGSPVPRWQGMRPGVNVTVALSTLLGLDDQSGHLAAADHRRPRTPDRLRPLHLPSAG